MRKRFDGTLYRGINYGSNTNTNQHPETGIRYGVINANWVPFWDESVDLVYPDPEEDEEGGQDSNYDLDPIAQVLDQEGYVAECHCQDSNDIWVLMSPYYTYAQFCSPCAPGACYLTVPLLEPHQDNKCYCLGADFFDQESKYSKCLYPIWDYKTNALVWAPWWKYPYCAGAWGTPKMAPNVTPRKERKAARSKHNQRARFELRRRGRG